MKTAYQDASVLTVTQVTHAIKHQLETSFPLIWVKGEISNSKLHSSGHFYFSIKDAKSQISAVMFRGSVSALKSIPKDGDEVIVKGSINVYPPSGKYQIIADEMQLMGLGDLLLRLEELKKDLLKRGWFKKEHKKPLPKFPKTIGVITSPTGAAIQDILNILTRRFSGFHLILNPVHVQGEGAAQEIAQAIDDFNTYQLADVLIVGRGGGSIEDLWAFNEEVVAKAIFHSKIPIIGAVGHETDHTIAEYVADIRAPTPSAAAEIVIAEKSLQEEKLHQYCTDIYRILSLQIQAKKMHLNSLIKQPLFQSPYYLLGPLFQKIDELSQKTVQAIKHVLAQKKLLLQARKNNLFTYNPKKVLSSQMEKIHNLTVYINIAWKNIFQRQKERFRHLVETLNHINPQKLLSKGYSILYDDKKRKVVTSIKEIQKNQKVIMQLVDGKASSTIDEILSD